jgi:hypothetical protein
MGYRSYNSGSTAQAPHLVSQPQSTTQSSTGVTLYNPNTNVYTLPSTFPNTKVSNVSNIATTALSTRPKAELVSRSNLIAQSSTNLSTYATPTTQQSSQIKNTLNDTLIDNNYSFVDIVNDYKSLVSMRLCSETVLPPDPVDTQERLALPAPNTLPTQLATAQFVPVNAISNLPEQKQSSTALTQTQPVLSKPLSFSYPRREQYANDEEIVKAVDIKQQPALTQIKRMPKQLTPYNESEYSYGTEIAELSTNQTNPDLLTLPLGNLSSNLPIKNQSLNALPLPRPHLVVPHLVVQPSTSNSVLKYSHNTNVVTLPSSYPPRSSEFENQLVNSSYDPVKKQDSILLTLPLGNLSSNQYSTALTQTQPNLYKSSSFSYPRREQYEDQEEIVKVVDIKQQQDSILSNLPLGTMSSNLANRVLRHVRNTAMNGVEFAIESLAEHIAYNMHHE